VTDTADTGISLGAVVTDTADASDEISSGQISAAQANARGAPPARAMRSDTDQRRRIRAPRA
jgi:hypothetical protein